MTLKENEQPTYLNGTVTETAVNTLTVLEIQVPRILSSKMLYDVDSVFIDVEQPIPTLGADATSFKTAQLVVSETTPSALLGLNDDRVIAHIRRVTYANATDRLYSDIDQGKSDWTTDKHANYIPDDKLWLVIEGAANRAGDLGTSWVRINGKLSKVTQDDFEALVLSRLGQ